MKNVNAVIEKYNRLEEVLDQGLLEMDAYIEILTQLENQLIEKSSTHPLRQLQELMSQTQALLLSCIFIKDLQSKKIRRLKGLVIEYDPTVQVKHQKKVPSKESTTSSVEKLIKYNYPERVNSPLYIKICFEEGPWKKKNLTLRINLGGDASLKAAIGLLNIKLNLLRQ